MFSVSWKIIPPSCSSPNVFDVNPNSFKIPSVCWPNSGGAKRTVFDPIDSNLRGLDNCLISPNCGWSTNSTNPVACTCGSSNNCCKSKTGPAGTPFYISIVVQSIALRELSRELKILRNCSRLAERASLSTNSLCRIRSSRSSKWQRFCH